MDLGQRRRRYTFRRRTGRMMPARSWSTSHQGKSGTCLDRCNLRSDTRHTTLTLACIARKGSGSSRYRAVRARSSSFPRSASSAHSRTRAVPATLRKQQQQQAETAEASLRQRTTSVPSTLTAHLLCGGRQPEARRPRLKWPLEDGREPD